MRRLSTEAGEHMTETKKRGPGRPKGSKNKSERISSAEKSTKQEKIREMQEKRKSDRKLIDEIWGVTIFALGVFLIFTTQLNTTGAFGEAVHDILKGLFGVMAYVLPYFLIVTAICLFLQKMQHINGRTTFFTILIYLMMCTLNGYRFVNANRPRFGFGDILLYYRDGVAGKNAGAVGMELAAVLVKLIGKPGLIIFALTLMAVSLLLVINTPISHQISALRERREEKRLVKKLEEADAVKVKDSSLSPQAAPPEPRASAEAIEPVRSRRKEKKSLFSSLFGRKKEEEISLTPPQEVPAGMIAPLRPFGEGPKIVGGATAGAAGKQLFAGSEKATAPADERSRQKFVDMMAEDAFSPAKAEETDGRGFGLDGNLPRREGFGLEGDLPKKSHSLGVSEYREPTPMPTTKADNKPSAADHEEIVREVAVGSTKRRIAYQFPPLDLLRKPKGNQTKMTDQQLAQRAQLLETTLNNFNVDAKVVQVTQGASVTRYEVQPATGVKVNKITGLADDIALNMRAKSIRIEAPIPGKAAVGIEVENETTAPVLIRELVDSPEFQTAKSKISFIVGKDIAGKNLIADLKEMPHLLIAGATGSGKSVCINTIITSLLYKASPDEVKLVLIDPKVVELGNYNGIPHMLIPVVTDPKKAAAALGWAVNEMTQRYKKFAEEGVKDLESYNELMNANQEPEKVMPQVVIVIDELADLMMASPSQVEESICRLAQMARAAGMHLIVATQRPSVDIVTGVIKANIPSRVAFSVSSQIDSRTILDMGGAEKLLGKGDMLFSPVGSNKPLRIQGPFITEAETAKVIEFVKKQGETQYDEEMIRSIETTDRTGASDVAGDELTEDAIAFILKQKQASVSMLQRRFRIGYNRAARIIDEIEERGVIGASDGARPRQILMTEEEYYGREETSSATEEVVKEGDDG